MLVERYNTNGIRHFCFCSGLIGYTREILSLGNPLYLHFVLNVVQVAEKTGYMNIANTIKMELRPANDICYLEKDSVVTNMLIILLDGPKLIHKAFNKVSL